MEFVEIGKTNIKVSRIGIGTWQWGTVSWGYGSQYTKEDLKSAFDTAIELGFNFFDTAEVYGDGESERLIGEFSEGMRESIVIASKVSPLHLTYKSVLRAFEGSARRLRTDYIDLYYVHWPNPLIPMSSTAKAFVKLHEEGKIRAIGVSNFSLKRMIKFDRLVDGKLSANQVKYSLLHREVERDLLPYCKENGITLVAYSPLDQGAITGKYDEKNLPKDIWRRMNPIFTKVNMRRIRPLIDALKELAAEYDVHPVNIVLRYLIAKGALPLVGVKNKRHVESLALTFEFKLKESDIKYLEEILSKIKLAKLRATPYILIRILKG